MMELKDLLQGINNFVVCTDLLDCDLTLEEVSEGFYSDDLEKALQDVRKIHRKPDTIMYYSNRSEYSDFFVGYKASKPLRNIVVRLAELAYEDANGDGDMESDENCTTAMLTCRSISSGGTLLSSEGFVTNGGWERRVYLCEDDSIFKSVMHGHRAKGDMEVLLAKIVNGFKIPLYSVSIFSTKETDFNPGEGYEFRDVYVGFKLGRLSLDTDSQGGDFDEWSVGLFF